MTERSAARRVRLETGWLAGGPLLRVPTVRRTTDIFLFIPHTTNAPLFKSRCNIVIGVRIIKKLPGLVDSGTICISYKFKFCKSVHHRTIQINHQPDAIIFQFIILTFAYSSSCFGRFPAHHQELNDCSGNLWFYLRIVVIAVPVITGPATNTTRLSPRYEGKTRGCHCSH
jgi:hypothetical protein